MNNQYLMPANSKKSRLIFGLFTPTDLVIIGIGAGITVLSLLILQEAKAWQTIIATMPLLIAAGLVFPVPNYHNVFQLLVNIINFVFGRKKYYWKGWCIKDDTED